MSYNIGVGGNQNLAGTSHVNDVISIFITIEKKIIYVKQSLLNETEFWSSFAFYKTPLLVLFCDIYIEAPGWKSQTNQMAFGHSWRY